MRYVSPSMQAKLDEGRIARTDMILFDFPAPHGQVGFFSGIGEFVWSGVTFRGAGTLFQVDTIGGSMDGTAVGLKIRLNGDAREGLDATALAQIETIQYRGRPVSLYRRYLDPDTYAPIDTILWYRGYLDTIGHHATEGGDIYVEAQVESRALDLGRSGYRKRTDADQRLIAANDGSLRWTATIAKKELKWANTPEWKPQKKGGNFLSKLFGG